MIDTSRWLLVEVWLSLGLRIEWEKPWDSKAVEWITCDETRQSFRYTGRGTWTVLDTGDHYRKFVKPERPYLGADTMRHELAHYLTATPAQRMEPNFGATNDDETRSIETERVIEAMLNGANRIAAMALVKP